MDINLKKSYVLVIWLIINKILLGVKLNKNHFHLGGCYPVDDGMNLLRGNFMSHIVTSEINFITFLLFSISPSH